MKKFFTYLAAATLMVSGVSAQTLRPELKESRKTKSALAVKARTPKMAEQKQLNSMKKGTAELPGMNKPENLMGIRDARLAKKGPKKVAAKGGAVIDGWLIFSDNIQYYDEMSYWNASAAETSINYLSPVAAFYGQEGYIAQPGGAYVYDGDIYLYGSVNLSFWGMMFTLGDFYAIIDQESGELLDTDIINQGWGGVTAINPTDNCIYGFVDGEDVSYFVKAPVENPLEMTPIKEVIYAKDYCTGMCYNTADNKFYGVNQQGALVRFDSQLNIEVLKTKQQLGVSDFYPYVGAMAYDSYDNTIYWNAQTKTGSALVNIDCAGLTSSRLFDYYGGDEFCMLYVEPRTVSDDAPEAGVINSLDIADGATTGSITFTLPTKALNGSALEGTLDWVLRVNGADLYQGKGNPGEKLTQTIYSLNPGQTVFQLSTSVDGKLGEPVSVSKFVGFDNPAAPQNVVLADNKITWDAVSTGEHDGYVDAAAMTYQAYLNGKAVGTATSETSVSVSIPASVDQEAYVASVVAICNGLESPVATSNKLVTGDPVQVPVTFAPSAAQWNVCQTQSATDVNWQYGDVGLGSNVLYIRYDENSELDAWVFLPAVNIPDSENFYKVSVQARSFQEEFPAEYFDIAVGDAADPAAMKVIAQDVNPTVETKEYSGLYRAPKAGTYYIGLHATSERDMSGIVAYNVQVSKTDFTVDSPAAVSNLSLQAAENGVLSATATFNMPTKTLGGKDLDKDAVISARVEGKTFVNVTGKPGEEISINVATEQSTRSSLSVVTVSPKLGKLAGPVSQSEVYTGVDLPGVCEITGSEVSEDNLSVTLSWDAPSAGENGGYFVPADCKYYLVQYLTTILGQGWYIMDEVDALSGTVTVDPGTVQDLAMVGVAAVNAAGNGIINYTTELLGEPQKLPISCDLKYSSEVDPFPGLDAYAVGGAGSWALATYGQLFEGADEGGMVVANIPSANGDEAYFMMPKFSTLGTTEAACCATLYNEEGLMPKVSFWVAAYGKDMVKFGEFSNDFEGFGTQNFRLPEEFQGLPWVQVYLVADYDDAANQMLLMRGIGANTKAPTVSGIGTIDSSLRLISGAKGMINLSGFDGQNVVVTRVDGARVADRKVSGDKAQIAVEKGVYVVKAGDKTAKVIVK